jgi:hypothetical protein
MAIGRPLPLEPNQMAVVFADAHVKKSMEEDQS